MPINVKYLIYLKPEELGIELLFRDLLSHNDGDTTELRNRLLREQSKLDQPPKKSHSDAAETECNVIKQAASYFSKFAFESATSATILDLQIALARIAHYMDRAVRS